MHHNRTSCDHRGNTFSGEYWLLGNGLEAAVRVHYRGDKLERKLGQRVAEDVAQDLLRELVVRETITLKVVAAEKAMGMHGPVQVMRTC